MARSENPRRYRPTFICYRAPYVRVFGARIFRIGVIAFVTYVAIAWSTAKGMAWAGWTVALSLLGAWLTLWLWGQRKRAKAVREARWERAIYDPDKRARAVAELRSAVKRLEPVKPGRRAEHARLSVLLAELLDAQGEHVDAMAAVDAVPLSALPPLDAGLVRHTRAVTHLRGADPVGAMHALAGREPSSDAELDQRLSLLEAYARVELGEAQEGLARADELAQVPGVDPSVITEARVVRAAALDVMGKREDALVVLAALGRESLTPLAELGHPRVRELAKVVLEGAAA